MKIFGFAGWSGSGKTTLIEKLIPLFVGRGLKVSLVKHAHHTFDVDQPGKLAKLEVYRASVGESLLYPQDPSIVAVASDAKVDTKLPQFDLNHAPAIASFVLKHVGLV